MRLLQIRALICHSLLTTTRVLLATFGFANWRKAFDKDIAVASDAAFEQEIPITVILISMLVIGVLLNILCWQKRHISYILIHYELVFNSILTLVPYDYGDLKTYGTFYSTLIVYLYSSCSGTSGLVDIVSCTVFTAV